MTTPFGPAAGPPPGGVAPVAAPAEQVFRLHRRSLVMPLISAGLVVVGLVALATTGEFDYRVLTIAAGVAVRIVQVVTTRVVVTSDRVRATWGWLWTSDKSIPLDRVQDVEIQRSLIARVLGLTQVEISSAGAGGSIKLSYFDLADAARFRDLLVRAGLDSAPAGAAVGAGPMAAPGAPAGAPGAPVAAVAGTERALHAVALSEIARTIVVTGPLTVLAFLIGIPLAVAVHPVAVIPALVLTALVVSQALGGWLTIGPGESSLRGDLLHTRQGLITLRNTNTPLRRIQILGAVAGPAYQLIGAEQVSFVSADAAVAKSERVRTMISPGARRGLADSLIVPILGVAPPTADRRQPLGTRVVRSNALRDAVRGVVAAPLIVLVGSIVTALVALAADEVDAARIVAVATVSVALSAPLVAGLAGAFAGWIRTDRSWIAIDDDCLVVHDGVWRLRTIAVPLAKVQAVDVTTDPAQRWCGTAAFSVDIAGVSGRWTVHVTDVDHDRALALADAIVRVASHVLLVDGV